MRKNSQYRDEISMVVIGMDAMRNCVYCHCFCHIAVQSSLVSCTWGGGANQLVKNTI